jgi:S1-C subfamily serine protease
MVAIAMVTIGLLPLLPLLPSVLAVTSDLERQARAITVRIEGTSGGTGILVDRRGNHYTVLTTAHIFRQPGDRHIVTPDGYCYGITRFLRLPKVDLAILQFVSSRPYAIAKLASRQGSKLAISPDQTVYVSGWAASGGWIQPRVFLITEGQIIANNAPLPLGYEITYDNLVRVGMSGGAILDAQAQLIGINGLVRYASASSKEIVGSGIPIRYFLEWYPKNCQKSPLNTDSIPRSPLKSPLKSPLIACP